MPVKRGFTLVEILVVVLIIGITLSFALLAFGDFGGKRRIIVSAEQFVSYIKLVRQQAILETSTLGIRFTNNTYQVLRFQGSSWQPLPQKSIFHIQKIHDSAMMTVETDTKGSPEIIINAAGDFTPFTIRFGSKHQAVIATVVGEYNGTVSVKEH